MNNDNPTSLTSVVVASYNHEDLMPEAFCYSLAQTRRDEKVIVDGDGSCFS